MRITIVFGKMKALNRIERKLDHLFNMGDATMAQLAEIRAEVERNRTVIGSNKVLLEGLAAKLEELAGNPQAIKELAAELRGDVDGFAADVAAHTAAEDEEEPEEEDPPILPPDPEEPEEPQNLGPTGLPRRSR